MKMRLKGTLRAAMEDAGPLLNVEPSLDEVGTAGSVDAMMDETEQARRYAEDAAGDAHVVDDVCEALEALVCSLEGHAVIGLTPRAAEFANHAINAQLARVGMDSGTLSMESFGGSKTRVEATQITLESLTDKLKQLWEAIKAMAARVWAAIQKFFANLLGTAGQLKRYAQTISNQASALPSGSTAGKYVDLSPRVASRLAIGARIDWSLPRQFADVATKLNGMSDDMTDTLQQINKDLLDVMVNGKPERLKAGIEGPLRKMFDKAEHCGSKTVEVGDNRVCTSPLMPGNVRLVMTFPIPEDAMESAPTPAKRFAAVADAIGKMRTTLDDEPVKGELVTGMDTLSVGDIRTLAQSVIKVCEWSQQFDQRIQQMAAQSKQAMDAAGNKITYLVGHALKEKNTLTLHSESKDDVEQMHSADIYRAFGRSSINVARPALIMQGYVLTLARAVMGAAHASLLEYQKKPAAETAPAAAVPVADADAAEKAKAAEAQAHVDAHDRITRSMGDRAKALGGTVTYSTKGL